MKLVTETDVIKLAKSAVSAMDVALIHWYQNFKGKIEELGFPLDGDLCGLCRFFNCDGSCPLEKSFECGYESSPYRKAYNAWPDSTLWPVAARKMFYVLIKLSKYKNQKDFLARLPKRYAKYVN